jgi:hypothetical protein
MFPVKSFFLPDDRVTFEAIELHFLTDFLLFDPAQLLTFGTINSFGN